MSKQRLPLPLSLITIFHASTLVLLTVLGPTDKSQSAMILSPWPDLSGRIDHNTTHGHGFCLASIFALGVRVHI